MKIGDKRSWVVTAICGGTALLFLALQWRNLEYEPLQILEFKTQDWRATFGVKTPKDDRLVLVGIDRSAYTSYFDPQEVESSLALQLLQTPFPWSRAVYAELITRLAEAGARVIVLDLVLPGAGAGDEELKRALDQYRQHVVIGANIRSLKSDRGGLESLDVPSSTILDSPDAKLDDRVGYVNVFPDWDGVLRRARYRLNSRDTDLLPKNAVMESLDARALRKSGHAELIPAGTDNTLFRYTSRAGGMFRVIPIGEVLSDKTWTANYGSGEFFRGKIVFVGPTADIFQDLHKTPFPDKVIQGAAFSSMMLGPEIHLNIISAALHKSFLRETTVPERLWITALAGLIASALSFFVRKPLTRMALLPVICIAYWMLAQWMFNRVNIILPVVGPLLLLALSGVLVLSYDYFLEQFERARLRRTLERYVSKDIVKELVENPQSYYNSLVGVRKPVTVLFSDVRGFTSLTEGSEAELVVKQLNEYFQEMVGQVFGFQGTLDKFIGDAVMAIWGSIRTRGAARDAEDAVATALAMRASLAGLNAGWKLRKMPELAIGIGINHGDAIVGNLGSEQKMDATVIGDAVNLASRLQDLTKQYHVDLLLGESVAPLVRERFILRSVDLVVPRGKTNIVEIFTVPGERTTTPDAPQESWLADYEEGVRLFRQRAFGEAAARFAKCLQSQPDDYLCALYGRSCARLLKEPPDVGWKGSLTIEAGD